MGRGTSTGNLLKGTRGDDKLTVTQRSSEAWTLDGGAGNDVLTGGSGADTLLGGSGNDILFGQLNDGKLDGGLGYDTLDLSGVSADLRYIASGGGQLTGWPDATPESYTIASGFERIIGGAGNDWIFGGAGNETLAGGGGADHLDGGAGDDVLAGDYLPLGSYNPLGRTSLPSDRGADFFEFSHQAGGADRVIDFELGVDHLFFYGVAQPDPAQIYAIGDNLIVPWANGTVTLAGLGGIDPGQYASLFTLSNGDIFVG